MNNITKLKLQINDLIYKKNLTKYEYYKLNYFIEEYKKLDKNNTPFIYVALAKHYLSIGNIKSAMKNLKLAEEINPNLTSVLYLEYRINTRLGNYSDAYKYLKMYEEKQNEKQKEKIDLSIYYYLFNIILGENNNILIDNTKNINGINIYDLKLKEMINDLKENILKENYRQAKIIIETINEYCVFKNIFLNLDEISLLIDKVILVKISNRKNIENEINQIKSLIIDNKLLEAEVRLENINNFRNYKNKKLQINLLKNFLNEKKEIQRLDKLNLYGVYEEYKRLGKLSCYYGDYYNAYQYFMAGYYLTNANIFKFYMARCLLFMGKTKEAMSLFIEYNKKGYSKILKSYKFLMTNRCFNCKERYKFKKEYYALKSVIEDDKKMEENHSNTDVKESIFFKDNITDNINDILDKFDEEENIDKLKYIKYLYQNNHQKIADKLLKQYEKEFNKDKNISKQVLQLRKNKLLYINQGKYSC